MKVTRRVGKAFKPLVNFPRWMGLNQLVVNGQAIVKMIKDMRVHRPAIHQESFEDAMARLHLTEEDIKNRIKTCALLSAVYSTAMLAFLIYSLYMIFHFQWGMIIGILITILMAVLAYREFFWYFQLKTRTLGNSFQDWLAYVLRGNRK